MTWNTEYEGAIAYVTHSDTPEVRYEVSPYTDVPDPIFDSGAPVEHFVVRAGYHSASAAPTGDLSRAFSRFNDELGEPLGVTRRYARIFLGYSEDEANNRIALVNTRGYSQSEWAELFVHVSEDGYGSAEGWAEEWAQWARGDVYGVTKQTRIACESCDCEDWEDSDSLWGIFADSAEDAASYFHNNY